jgi:predicted DCC family thiol-disulfide oxidoreductase YuxK
LNIKTTEADNKSIVNQIPNNVVLFDELCVLCNRTVQFLCTIDKAGVLRFSSLQGDLGSKVRNLEPTATSESVVFLKDGAVYKKSRAVIEILKSLPFPWPIIGMFGQLMPLFIADWQYDQIAKNRYRIFGKQDACELPNGKWKDRILS